MLISFAGWRLSLQPRKLMASNKASRSYTSSLLEWYSTLTLTHFTPSDDISAQYGLRISEDIINQQYPGLSHGKKYKLALELLDRDAHLRLVTVSAFMGFIKEM